MCQFVLMTEQFDTPASSDDADPKRAAILHAAFDVFLTYGYRRSSMEDIAGKAGMSRPALYLHFRNKEDIFRALTRVYYDEAAEGVAAALAQSGPVPDVLTRAFMAQAGDRFEAMVRSPHGSEFLEAGSAVSTDIWKEGTARIVVLYTEWLEREAAAGRVLLAAPADLTAETMILSLKSTKTSPSPNYVHRVKALAQMFGRGLQA